MDECHCEDCCQPIVFSLADMHVPPYYTCGDDVGIVRITIAGIEYFPTDDLAAMPDGLPGVVYKTREIQ